MYCSTSFCSPVRTYSGGIWRVWSQQQGRNHAIRVKTQLQQQRLQKRARKKASKQANNGEQLAFRAFKLSLKRNRVTSLLAGSLRRKMEPRYQVENERRLTNLCGPKRRRKKEPEGGKQASKLSEEGKTEQS